MKKRDPICGMTVDTENKKTKVLLDKKEKKTYYFCSEHCKEEFKKHKGKKPTRWYQSETFAKVFPWILAILLLTGSYYAYTTNNMTTYMGIFMTLFSLAKLLDLQGFTQAFKQYDILAKQSPLYAQAYPFIELLTGILFLTNNYTTIAAYIVLFIYSIGIIGIIQKLLQKRPFQCACLGTKIKVPLTKVTLLENIIMILMALMLLLGGIQYTYMVGFDESQMPCHKMGDGSLMGNCTQADKERLGNEGITRRTISNILPGQGNGFITNGKAKSSTIIDLQEGETYSITADIIEKEINGNTITMYGYNGMIPGPALRVKQGSTINIEFKNNIDMNTTIHWHGLRHDIQDDGVPGTSQDPVQPGETYNYELYFPDDGIYWYHPHVREDIQQEAGLAGNMLVTPTTPYNEVNREELLILDDILLDRNGQYIPFGGEHANFAIMGRYGNTMLTNGETNYKLQIQKGEVVRFYITNVANVRPYNISIPGAQMKLIGGDLGEYEQETFVNNTIIAPAMRAIIDAYFENEGAYNIQNINPHKTYTLGTITVTEDETQTSHKETFQKELINTEVIEDIKRFEPYFDKPIDYDLKLDIDMQGMMNMMDQMPCHEMGGIIMGRCTEEERTELEEELGHKEMAIEWEDEMNMRAPGEHIEWIIEDKKTKKQNMEIGMKANVGDIIKMRIFNDPNSLHPMQHPIHLHGQRALLLSMDGEEIQNKVWADTILIPIGSTAELLVDVTNPGEWMMHCHIAEHLEAGMMTSFTVEGENKHYI